MSFVQFLEFDTKQAADVEALMTEWRIELAAKRTSGHEIVARDHTRPNHYVAIVEYPSWEEAERSNKLPASERFTEKMAKLCDGPVKYGDYDVIRDKN